MLIPVASIVSPANEITIKSLKEALESKRKAEQFQIAAFPKGFVFPAGIAKIRRDLRCEFSDVRGRFVIPRPGDNFALAAHNLTRAMLH